MDGATERGKQENRQPVCLDVSPERLAALSPAQLEREMEEALSVMAEEDTYDPAVLDAYLEALDRRAPMPEHLDGRASYAAFRRRVRGVSQAVELEEAPVRGKSGRLRRVLRAGLAAALVAAGLLGTLVAAQASGLDVFGTLAYWTDSFFTFRSEAEGGEQREGGESLPAMEGGEVPEEFQGMYAELSKQGRSLCVPRFFEELTPTDSYLDQRREGELELSVVYEWGEASLCFDARFWPDGRPLTIYEKDGRETEQYSWGGVDYYLFHNLEQSVAAWQLDGVEYSISTTLPHEELKPVLQSVAAAEPEEEASPRPGDGLAVWQELTDRGVKSITLLPSSEDCQTVFQELYVQYQTEEVEFRSAHYWGSDRLDFFLHWGETGELPVTVEGPPEEQYRQNGVDIQLFSQPEGRTALWELDGVKYALTADLSREKLKEVLGLLAIQQDQ